MTAKMKEQDFLAVFEDAYNKGIEVRIAKNQFDSHIDGIHVLEPNIGELMDSVLNAMEFGTNIVVIHSKITWPYFKLIPRGNQYET